MKHVFKPGNGSGKTLVVFHGTGGDENDLISVAQMIDSDANILSLRGNVLENGMRRFFRRLSEGAFDEEDIKFRSKEIIDFLREAKEKYGIDLENLTAVGYSNGANIIAAIMLIHGETFNISILFHPTVPLKEIPDHDLTGKKVFVGASMNDSIIPIRHTEQLESILREKGAEVTSKRYMKGHTLIIDEAMTPKNG